MSTYRITAVCLGNICRSPMAESVLRHKIEQAGLADRVEVDSAGTAGYHVGGTADARAEATLHEAGYPISHQARQFRGEWLAETDLVLAMDASNLSDLRALADRAGHPGDHIHLFRTFDPDADGHEVPDPYYGGREGFQEVLRMVEAAADGVVEYVSARLDEPSQ